MMRPTYPNPLVSAPVKDAAGNTGYGIIAPVALTVLIVIADVAGVGVNVAILYLLPMLLVAYTAPGHRRIIGSAAVLSVLTYFIYAFEYRHHLTTDPWTAVTFRLLNRSFVVTTLWIMAGVRLAWHRMHRSRRGDPAEGSGRAVSMFDEISDSLTILSAAITCVAVVFCVATTDLIVPGQFNLPILYAIPVLVAGQSGRPKILWGTVLALLLMNVIGFVWGTPPTLDEHWLIRLIANRTLAGLGLLSIALLIHLRLSRRFSMEIRPRSASSLS